MNQKKSKAFAAAGALLAGMLLSTASLAHDQRSFSALQGVEAEAMSPQDMGAVTGRLNAYDIAYALTAEATKLSLYPKLQADDLKLASYVLANAVAINAVFEKFGVLTPCKTCR